MAVLESYNAQLENLGRQVQVLQASMDDLTRARNTLKTLENSKEGDEVLLPIGGSSYINTTVTKTTKVIVGVGTRTSVEKTIAEAMTFIENNGNEVSEALRKAAGAMTEIEAMANDLQMAIENEYRNRQQ